jgi:hypothetical protein
MADLSRIREHMEIIGADGVHVGTVDKVDGDRIKLIKADSGSHSDHHHYVSVGLVADIEGDKVRLSANGDNAVLLEEEKDGSGLGESSLFSWRNIGIGAAAVAGVAAAAGAAAMVRGRGSKSGGSKSKSSGGGTGSTGKSSGASSKSSDASSKSRSKTKA